MTRRDNASRMEKLVATKRAIPPEKTTAIDDLKTYQEFAEAHLDGLKHLTSAISYGGANSLGELRQRFMQEPERYLVRLSTASRHETARRGWSPRPRRACRACAAC